MATETIQTRETTLEERIVKRAKILKETVAQKLLDVSLSYPHTERRAQFSYLASSILRSLEVKYIPDPTLIAACDEKTLYVGPLFEPVLKKYGVKVGALILLHEALHIMYAHPQRQSLSDDKYLYNIVADLYVNTILESLLRVNIPDDFVTLRSFAETVAEELSLPEDKLDILDRLARMVVDGELTVEQVYNILSMIPGLPEYMAEMFKEKKFFGHDIIDSDNQRIGSGGVPVDMSEYMEGQQGKMQKEKATGKGAGKQAKDKEGKTEPGEGEAEGEGMGGKEEKGVPGKVTPKGREKERASEKTGEGAEQEPGESGKGGGGGEREPASKEEKEEGKGAGKGAEGQREREKREGSGKGEGQEEEEAEGKEKEGKGKPGKGQKPDKKPKEMGGEEGEGAEEEISIEEAVKRGQSLLKRLGDIKMTIEELLEKLHQALGEYNALAKIRTERQGRHFGTLPGVMGVHEYRLLKSLSMTLEILFLSEVGETISDTRVTYTRFDDDAYWLPATEDVPRRVFLALVDSSPSIPSYHLDIFLNMVAKAIKTYDVEVMMSVFSVGEVYYKVLTMDTISSTRLLKKEMSVRRGMGTVWDKSIAERLEEAMKRGVRLVEVLSDFYIGFTPEAREAIMRFKRVGGRISCWSSTGQFADFCDFRHLLPRLGRRAEEARVLSLAQTVAQ